MAELISYPIELPDEPRVWRGDPFDWTLALAAAESDDGELVDPVDLTGYGTSWAATARGGDASIDFDIDDEQAAAGWIVLLLSSEQTAALRPNARYQFDVQASGGTRTPFTVWTGSILAVGDYTRP